MSTESEFQFFCQSILFVPANRFERIGKALSSNADSICIDLEDAVPDEEKNLARENLKNLGQALSDDKVFVRINSINSNFYSDDIKFISNLGMSKLRLMLPKAQSPNEIDNLISDIINLNPKVEKISIIALLETPTGVRNSNQICAHENVIALMFGGADFAASIGAEFKWEPLLLARQIVVMSAAEWDKPAIDVPFIELSNIEGLIEECQRAKSIGFYAKAAIHPNQINSIHQIFRPSIEEIRSAKDAIAAFEAAGGRAIRFGSKMLEAPIIKQYRRILGFTGAQNA